MLVSENDSYISLDFTNDKGNRETIAVPKTASRTQTLDNVKKKINEIGLNPLYTIRERRTVDDELYISRLTSKDQQYLSRK